MDVDLKLLAFAPSLDAETRLYCARREQKFPYFREGYVDLNLGRHIEYTEAIRESAESYAVADAAGVVRAKYKTLVRAQEAIEAARPKFIADIELDPDMDEAVATA